MELDLYKHALVGLKFEIERYSEFFGRLPDRVYISDALAEEAKKQNVVPQVVKIKSVFGVPCFVDYTLPSDHFAYHVAGVTVDLGEKPKEEGFGCTSSD